MTRLLSCPLNSSHQLASESSMAVAGGRFRLATVAVLPVTASGASTNDKVSFVKKTVKSHDIVIFSKSHCPYCKRAKAVFKELKKDPYVMELDKRDDGSDIQDALLEFVGRRTVPQVFIHGEHLGGSDDTVDAYQSGKLLTLLGIGTESEL